MNATLEHPVADPVSESEATPLENGSATFFNSLVGITQASAITGKNKGTLSKDSKSGKLKFELNDKGERQYKVSELYQIYGLKQPDADKEKTGLHEQKQPDENTPATALELALLRQELKHKEEIIQRVEAEKRRVEDENRDLKQLRDTLVNQTERLTLLLPAPATEPAPQTPPAATSEQPKPETSPLTFWQRVFFPKKQ